MNIKPINNTNFKARIVRVKKFKESRDNYSSIRNSILSDDNLNRDDKKQMLEKKANIYQNSVELDLIIRSNEIKEKMKQLPAKDILYFDAFNFKDGAISLRYEANARKSKNKIEELDDELAYELLHLNEVSKKGKLDKTKVNLWFDRLYSFLK